MNAPVKLFIRYSIPSVVSERQIKAPTKSICHFLLGEDGIDGLHGKPGHDGRSYKGGPCEPCAEGLTGPPGPSGVRGPRGPRGPKGKDGYPGMSKAFSIKSKIYSSKPVA